MKEEDIQLVKVGPQGLGRREMKRDEGKNCLSLKERRGYQSWAIVSKKKGSIVKANMTLTWCETE